MYIAGSITNDENFKHKFDELIGSSKVPYIFNFKLILSDFLFNLSPTIGPKQSPVILSVPIHKNTKLEYVTFFLFNSL